MDLIFCWFMSILGSLISLTSSVSAFRSSFFPSGAYFSLFCLSFSVSDTSAPASLDVQCDRWNMTAEKNKVSVLPASGKVTCKHLNKKGKKVYFSVLNILHSKRHSIFRNCTGDTLNNTYSIVHPIKLCSQFSPWSVSVYTYIYNQLC